MSGLQVLAETPGTGKKAGRGDVVRFASAATLKSGQVVHERQESETLIGSRRLVAGVEKSLVGMCEGGYRRVRISPHLAYRDQGVPGRVPPNAVLDYEFWLLTVRNSSPPAPPP